MTAEEDSPTKIVFINFFKHVSKCKLSLLMDITYRLLDNIRG